MRKDAIVGGDHKTMRNFVFISPNFPTNYWMFCRELKNNGINVLGIGDQPYEELNPSLRDSLNEYYKVSNLENNDEVYRAIAYFIFKHGRIEWIESNNEYWLERDAKLRTDFNVTTSFQTNDILRIKFKSKMKEFYIKAGLSVARITQRNSSTKLDILWLLSLITVLVLPIPSKSRMMNSSVHSLHRSGMIPSILWKNSFTVK